GIRDFHVTGVQTCALPILNPRQGVLRVTGKGNKERLVPLGEEALAWIVRYCAEARPVLLKGQPSDVLFPSQQARQMTRQTFWHRSEERRVGKVSRARGLP